MATPTDLLAAAKGKLAAQSPNTSRGGPARGGIAARPPVLTRKPALTHIGGTEGSAQQGPQKPAWQQLREAGIGGQGSAAANKAAAAQLGAGGDTIRSMPTPDMGGGMKVGPEAGGSMGMEKPPMLGFKPGEFPPSGGIVALPPNPGGPGSPFNPGSPMAKPMPGGIGSSSLPPGNGVGGMPPPGAGPMPFDGNARPPQLGAIADTVPPPPGGGGYEALGKIGAGLQRRRPPQLNEDFMA